MIALFLLVLAAGCAARQPDARSWIDRMMGGGVDTARDFGGNPTTAQTTIWSFAPFVFGAAVCVIAGVVMFILGNRGGGLVVILLGGGLSLFAAVLVGMLKSSWAPWLIGIGTAVMLAGFLLSGGLKTWHLHRHNGKGWKLYPPWRKHEHDDHGNPVDHDLGSQAERAVVEAELEAVT